MRVSKMILTVIALFIGILILAQTAIVVVPNIFGCRCYAVMTNSMYPTLKIGDLIVVKPVAFEDIAINDLVTFGSAQKQDHVFTHRVESIDRKNKTLYTKGDANSSTDVAPTPYDNAIGRMVISFPMLGRIGIFIKTDSGIRLFIGITALWLVLELAYFIFKRKKAK